MVSFSSFKNNFSLRNILVFVAIVLLYVVVLGPFLTRRAGLAEKIHISQRKLVQGERLLELSDERRSQFELLQKKSVSKKLSPEQVQANFLKQLEAFVREAGINITDVQVLSDDDGEKVGRYSIAIEAEGLIEQLNDVLHHLLEIEDLIQVERFSIERKDASSQTLFLKMIITKTQP